METLMIMDTLAIMYNGKARREAVLRRAYKPRRARYYWRVVLGPNWCRYGREFKKSATVASVINALNTKYPHNRRVEVSTQPF